MSTVPGSPLAGTPVSAVVPVKERATWADWAWYAIPTSIVLAILALGVWVCWPSPASVPTITLTGSPANPIPVGEYVEIRAVTKGKHVQWKVLDPGLKLPPPSWRSTDPKLYVVECPTAGSYRVAAWTSYRDLPSTQEVYTVVVGGPGPTPPGPVPPGPTPPVPPPDPAPIPTPGLRCLIVYHDQDLPKLPKEQAAVITSDEVRAYLTAKCVKGPDGKQAEWRAYDDATDMSKETAVWQGAMKLPRTSLPWIIVSDGKTGYSGPLPGNIADTLTLLKKYGG